MKFKKETELERAHTFYASIIHRFHQALFGLDHDHPDTPKADFFIIFNKAWVTFAERFNKKSKNWQVDVNAFYDYAIKRD